jgi:hypothetical protein
MSLFKKRVFPYLLVTPFVLALSSCFDSNNSSKTNPDFNQDVLFTDYGTYGRTIYFNDDEGSTWCYYDLLTFNNSSELQFTLSTPMKNKCDTTHNLKMLTYTALVSGELKDNNGDLIINTTRPDTVHEYRTYYSLEEYSEVTTKLIEFLKFFPGNNQLAVTLILSTNNDGYFANVPFITDFMIPNIYDESYFNQVGYFDAHTDASGTAEYTREEVRDIYIEVMDILGFTYPLQNELPYPSHYEPFFPWYVPNRHDVYQKHRYQKLVTTDEDPYPLAQIATD